MYEEMRREIGKLLRSLAEQRGCWIDEGHLLRDHVHILISIPPKTSVSDAIGFMKGKSAIHIGRNFAPSRRNGLGQSFWARGYFVSTVGRNLEVIRKYVRDQQEEDERLERLKVWR
jgi:putative transposase